MAWEYKNALKTVEESCGYADVVLAIGFCVGNLGVNVVHLNEVKAESAVEPGGDPAAGAEAEGVAIDDELEVDVLLRATQQNLGVGDIALVVAPGVPGPEEIVDD